MTTCSRPPQVGNSVGTEPPIRAASHGCFSRGGSHTGVAIIQSGRGFDECFSFLCFPGLTPPTPPPAPRRRRYPFPQEFCTGGQPDLSPAVPGLRPRLLPPLQEDRRDRRRECARLPWHAIAHGYRAVIPPSTHDPALRGCLAAQCPPRPTPLLHPPAAQRCPMAAFLTRACPSPSPCHACPHSHNALSTRPYSASP